MKSLSNTTVVLRITAWTTSLLAIWQHDLTWFVVGGAASSAWSMHVAMIRVASSCKFSVVYSVGEFCSLPFLPFVSNESKFRTFFKNVFSNGHEYTYHPNNHHVLHVLHVLKTKNHRFSLKNTRARFPWHPVHPSSSWFAPKAHRSHQGSCTGSGVQLLMIKLWKSDSKSGYFQIGSNFDQKMLHTAL